MSLRTPDKTANIVVPTRDGALEKQIRNDPVDSTIHMSNKAAGVVAASDVGILKNNVFDIIAAITAWLSYVPNCSLHVAEEAVVTVTAVIDCQVPDDVVVAIEITSERMVWRADGCPVLPAHVEVAYQAEVFVYKARRARVYQKGNPGEVGFAVDDVRVALRACVGIVVLAIVE